MITAALLPLLWIASFQDPVPVPQDPAPEVPAVPQDPAVPETEPPSDPDAELMAEIQALVEKVRDGFRQVDVALKGVQDTADAEADAAPEARPAAEVFNGEIGAAIDKADALTADIEELLAKLPESDNPSQSPSSSQRPQQQRPQDQRPQDQNDPNRPDGMQEMPDGVSPPPDAPTIRLFFDARYGAWGTLPERLQATLENATTEDLPLRYRRWLDAYHRRSLEPRR